MGKIKTGAQNLAGAARNIVADVKTHWDKPHDGEYVSYKEFMAFVIGSGSSMNASCTAGNLSFTAGCMFVGAIYGLKMMDFAMLGIVGMILNYLFAPFGMIITDNLGSPPKKTMRMINKVNIIFTIVGILCFFVPQHYFESFMPALPQVVGTKFLMHVFSTYYNIIVLRKLSPKFGKYRSWIVAGVLPYTIMMLVLVWFPYNVLPYHQKFWVMNLMFAFWGSFGACFVQAGSIQNVISPNTNERTKIISIGSFISGMFPSIYNILFPVFATMAGGITSINTYRIVVPVLVIVMIPLTFFLAFGVKDRVVQEQEHKPDVNMRKGFKEVLRNKYLWITNISGWITMFSAGSINIVNMLIIYSMRADWAMGIISSILGTAYTPGMLLSPWLVKKFGKRNIILCCKYLMVICSFLSIAGVFMNSLLIIVISQYISTMFSSVLSIVQPAMNADIWDYQQYISGERLDGCMGIFGYLASPITTFAAMVVPFVYGLIGFTSDWNILYDNTLRNEVFIVTIVITGLTGVLSAIPYHFYDMTEARHEEMMDEMRERLESADNAEEAVVSEEV